MPLAHAKKLNTGNYKHFTRLLFYALDDCQCNFPYFALYHGELDVDPSLWEGSIGYAPRKTRKINRTRLR